MSRWARVARKYTFTDGAAFLLPVLDPRREAARRVIVRSFAFSSTAGVLVAFSFLLALALVRTVLSATFGLADAFVSVVLVYVGYLGAVVFGAWRARGDFWFLGGPEGESVMITGNRRLAGG